MLEADKPNLRKIVSTNLVDSRLTYVGPAEGRDSTGRRLSRYACICGNVVLRARSVVEGRNRMKSCGCLKRDRGMLLVIQLREKAHAAGRVKNRTHGMSKTRFYGLWNAMLTRCANPTSKSYRHYGARGITVDDRWLKFENFRDDMYESYLQHRATNATTTIERIDNDKGYSKENCRWATRLEQARNTRRYGKRAT